METELLTLKHQLNSHYSYKAKIASTSVWKACYEHRNKCGRLLSSALCEQQLFSYVPSITNFNGFKVNHPPEIGSAYSVLLFCFI